MDIRTALKDLAGTWRGSNLLWLSPDEPVRQSEGSVEVHLGAHEAFSIIRYTWADQGQPQDGLLVVQRAVTRARSMASGSTRGTWGRRS